MSMLLLTMGPQLGITAELPVVSVGGAGVIRFRATGAAGLVKWTLVDSTLPAEWDSALNPDGNAVTLTTADAETAGTFSVTVRAEDSARIPVVRSFEVRVMALPLTISGAFPEWITGLPATGALTISGGVPPYSGLAVTAGVLPSGVSLSIVGNQIVASGTPTVAGPWAATLRVSDSAATMAEISATGTVARLWAPADLPVAPKIWLDWESSVVNDSGAASQWDNRGALGGFFSQPTASARPVIMEAELNSRRVLRFDGVDDTLYADSGALQNLFRNVTSAWVFAVYKKRGSDPSPANRAIFVSRTNTTSYRFALMAGGVQADAHNRPSTGGRRLDSDSYVGLNGTVRRSGAWALGMGVGNYEDRTLRLFIDGSLDSSDAAWFTSGSTSNTAAQAIFIASNTIGGTTDCGDVDVAILLAGSSALAQADIDRIHGWAAWQCGLQANLPSDHPYRYTPPVVSP